MKTVQADAESMAQIQVGEAESKLRKADFEERQAKMGLSRATDYRKYAEAELAAAELILELVKGSHQ